MTVSSLGGIYISTNFGISFTVTSAIITNYVAISASGQYQTASNTTNIYTSQNYGQTWTQNTQSFSSAYKLAMSSSGQYQACIQNNLTKIYISTNFGITWSSDISIVPSGHNLSNIAMSSSGQYIAVGSLQNDDLTYPQIYISSLPVLINSNVTVSGTVTAAAFVATSDYRVKDNVKEMDENYTIDNLRPVHYDNQLTRKHDIGFIAHEVQEIFPFLVNGLKDGPQNQSLNYIGLIGLLVKEIQELKDTVTKLEKKAGNI
jgi:photosystem II stability/assembly factor-like uncharacterized protein